MPCVMESSVIIIGFCQLHDWHKWLRGVIVTMLDLRSRGREFNSWSGRYQVVTIWMGDCLWTGKASQYIINTKINSAFHPSGVLPACLTGVKAGAFTCVGWQIMLCDPIWQVTLRSFEMGTIKSCRRRATFNLHNLYHGKWLMIVNMVMWRSAARSRGWEQHWSRVLLTGCRAWSWSCHAWSEFH